jgi:hypothetical protein
VERGGEGTEAEIIDRLGSGRAVDTVEESCDLEEPASVFQEFVVE